MTDPNPQVARLRQTLGANGLAMLPSLLARGKPKGLPDGVWEAMNELARQEHTMSMARRMPRESVSDIGSAGVMPEQNHPFLRGLALLAEGFAQIPGAMAAAAAKPGGGEDAGGRFGEAGPPIESRPAPEKMQQLSDRLATANMTGIQLVQQFGHDISVGAIDSPVFEDPNMQMAWNAVVVPTTTIGAMLAQGRAVMAPLGYFSKLPRMTAILEQVPARMKEVGAGTVVGGVIDAMRADGVPDEAPWYDPSGKIAKRLSDAGMPDRLALFTGGAAVGGLVGAAVLGVARGVQAGRTSYYLNKLSQDPKALESMRSALLQSGVQVPDAMQPRQVAKMFAEMRKVALDESLAGTVGDRAAREEYIVNELFASANIAPSDEDVRLIAGIFRTNTGGISVVKDVALQPRTWQRTQMTEHGTFGLQEIKTNIKGGKVPPTTVVEEASKRLGLRLQFMRVRTGERVNIANRPSVASADEVVVAPATKLADGKIIAGGTSHSDALDWAAEQARVTKSPDMFMNVNIALTEQREASRGAWTSNNRFVPWKEATQMMRKQHGKQVARSTDVEWGKMPVTEVNEIQAVKEVTPTYDLIISRPKYEYPSVLSIGKKAERIGKAINDLARKNRAAVGQAVSKEAWLLADGTPTRGGFNLPDIEARAQLQRPMVAGAERPDIALRLQGKIARMELLEEGRIKIELPPSITQEQFDALGRMFDARAFDEVTLVGYNNKQVRLLNPFGAQVQDGITTLVQPSKVSTRLTPQMVQQYKSQGVFDGQAGVLSDGTPVSIVRSLGHKDAIGPTSIQVRDPVTGSYKDVHASQLTTLPTTLEGEFKPSNLFNEALLPEERAAFARIRQSLNAGLGKEIRTFRQLESFASARGFVVNSLGGGKVEFTHTLSGEVRQFSGRKAAVEFLRTANGPMPELTPAEISQLLGGDNHVGFVGGGGVPPRFGETMPLPWGRIMAGLDQVVTNRGPGAIEQFFKPSLALMESIDKQFKTQTLPVFMRGQTQHVHMTNFIAKWYKGLGAKLPEGVVPLQRIQKLGGSNADWERVSHILETAEGTADYQRLVSEATKGEVEAAKAIRKWDAAMLDELGAEADFISTYGPVWRANAGKYGNQPEEIWKALGNDPVKMPRGIQFFADQFKSGQIDIYDEHALRVRANYLHQGASNAFMKEWYDDASKYVMMLGAQNKSAAMPLANVIQAMKGTEFLDQRAALQETMRALMEKLPGGALSKSESDIADKMVNVALGTVYASAFGARPSSALRNAFSAVYMSWPLFAGRRSDWLEAVGRALTQGGKMAAVEDGAIALKQSAMFMREEVQAAMPKNYEWAIDKTMYLYDSADEFTRATSYWSGRIAAEKALTRFAKDVQGASPEKIAALKTRLIEDSGLWLHDQQVVDDFLRRAANSPDEAAKFAGKMASDVTNFLYGRGMQARWMRSVPGRFLGQFGTWSMWYLDYLRRIGGRALTLQNSPYRMKAIATLARHALVNGAVIAAGHEILEVDLNRWASYGSLFYSGGPGFQAALGASTLVRGIGETLSGSEDPLAKARVSEGSQMLLQTTRSFLPFFGVAKDAIRFGTSDDPVDRLAAILGTKPTRDYDFDRRMRLLLGQEVQPFSSSSETVADLLNAKALGRTEQIVDIRSAAALRQAQQHVREQAPVAGAGGAGTRQGSNLTSTFARIRSNTPPAAAYPQGGEATKPAEARPPNQF